MPDKRQVGVLVDSLRVIGIDRQNLIISEKAEEHKYHDIEEAIDAIMVFIKSESNQRPVAMYSQAFDLVYI